MGKEGRSRPPWATGGIVALTLLAYVWVATRSDADYDRVLEAGAIRADAPRPAAYLTSLALHASLLHLGVNLLLLGLYGPSLETRTRSWGLGLLYVLSGVAGGLAHVALAPAALRPMALVGASGAVSGLLGAHAVLLPGKSLRLAIAALWLLANLLGILLIDPAGARGLSYASHLGGLAAGLLLGFLLGKVAGPARR